MDTKFEKELAAIRPKVLAMTERFFRASRMQGDPEDIVQDVLLRLWTALRDGTDIRNAEAWAVRCTKNACISALRKAGGSRHYPLFETIMDTASASAGLDLAETEARLGRSLERLPAETRHLLRLRAGGLSLDEIAVVTGRPKGSIKTSISAARKELMKTL